MGFLFGCYVYWLVALGLLILLGVVCFELFVCGWWAGCIWFVYAAAACVKLWLVGCGFVFGLTLYLWDGY